MIDELKAWAKWVRHLWISRTPLERLAMFWLHFLTIGVCAVAGLFLLTMLVIASWDYWQVTVFDVVLCFTVWASWKVSND